MTANDETPKTDDVEPPDAVDLPPKADPAPPGATDVPGILRVAAIASLGAGAIHATAAGAHSEHRSAVIAFVLTAVAQIGWGAWAYSRAGRLVCLVGAAVNAAAVGGWVLAKTSGIGFVTGLDAKESVQFADALAAGLAAVAVFGALAALVGRLSFSTGPHPALVAVAGVAVVALAIPGMVRTGSHSHAGGHGAETAGHAHGAAAGADGHDHSARPRRRPSPTTPPCPSISAARRA